MFYNQSMMSKWNLDFKKSTQHITPLQFTQSQLSYNLIVIVMGTFQFENIIFKMEIKIFILSRVF